MFPQDAYRKQHYCVQSVVRVIYQLQEAKARKEYIEDIYFFEVNAKYISSSVLKTSEFS